MAQQLLHLVLGGELLSLDSVEFRDLSKVHVVGVYPNYAKARDAWKAAAQATVDNAHMRYFVVHLHRLLDPNEDHGAQKPAKSVARKAVAGAKTGAKKGGKSKKTANRR
jgi:Domain of unknown function (DUF4170)